MSWIWGYWESGGLYPQNRKQLKLTDKTLTSFEIYKKHFSEKNVKLSCQLTSLGMKKEVAEKYTIVTFL